MNIVERLKQIDYKEIKEGIIFYLALAGLCAMCCFVVSLCVLGTMFLILWLIGLV